jgi:hypothetical protein
VVQPRRASARGGLAAGEAAEGRGRPAPVGQGLDPLERGPRQARGDPRSPRVAERGREDARARSRAAGAGEGGKDVLRRGPARDGRLQPGSGRPAQHVRRDKGLPEAPRAGHHGPGHDPRDPAEDPARQDALRRRLQVGRDDRDALAFRLLLGPGAEDRAGWKGWPPVRRHHRPGHVAGEAGEGARLPLDLLQPTRHRRALLGPELFRARSRRPDGCERRRAARARDGDGQLVCRLGAGPDQPWRVAWR